ncbi:helix-turn-helix domain-containing protein [Phenylobacterium sp.]|uniref:GlxA family transcriptional regulator n=1 Tax=Phenylobacterium sp. TaxID=1871053 RepID=UPI0025D668F4|nr:helix-turn-helix domain-containing protein [Phenylobacterium sp.]
MLDVTIVLLEDGFSSTAVMPLEIFHSAGRLWNVLHENPSEPAFRARTVTLDGGPVRGAHGLGATPHGALADVARTDVVIVSTSSLDLDLASVADSPLLPWLRRQHEQGALVVGVCMGVAYLAEAGLLDGRAGATHWALADKFAGRYPDVCWRREQFITEDNRVLCSGGVFASVDVSLYLVEKLCGHEIAAQCARSLLLSMPRIPQSGYAGQTLSQAHGDERVRRIEAFLQANYRRDDLSTPCLAERAGLGERTFVRHFKAATGQLPAAYLQALRIQAAKVMLERDAKPIQAISTEVGYDDVAFFRSLFKRMTRMTPTEYRARFTPLKAPTPTRLQAPERRFDRPRSSPCATL